MRPDSALTSVSSDGPGPQLRVPRSYLEAREKFLKLSRVKGAELHSFLNPHAVGISDEDVYCDIALIGSKSAKTLIVLSSGTHGVEGYCGSALQIKILSNIDLYLSQLPDTAFLFVHALNPYGFSHSMRTNENNVDINRNFVDFASIPQPDTAYEMFSEAVYPSNWAGSDLNAIYETVDRYIAKYGEQKFQFHMSQGQYQFADHPYYGGKSPEWSHQIWEEICAQYLAGTDRVIHIDIHTGLGAFAECQIIYTGALHQENLQAAKLLFGSENIIPPGEANSLTPEIVGPLATSVLKHAPKAIAVAFEFGTYPKTTVLKSIIAANWLHQNPSCSDVQRDSIRKQVHDAFCSHDPSWIDQIWRNTETHLNNVIAGIVSGK